MFRVSKAEERSGTVITIDGQLSRDYIELVENCCNQAISEGKRVCLFLRDVPNVNQDGRDLLSRLAARGVRLCAAGIYTQYLVRELNRRAAERK